MNRRKAVIIFGIIVLIICGFFLTQYYFSNKFISQVTQKLNTQNYNQLEISEVQRDIIISFFSEVSTDTPINSKIVSRTNNIKELLVSVKEINYTDDNKVSHVINGSLLLQIKRINFFQYQIIDIKIMEEVN